MPRARGCEEADCPLVADGQVAGRKGQVGVGCIAAFSMGCVVVNQVHCLLGESGVSDGLLSIASKFGCWVMKTTHARSILDSIWGRAPWLLFQHPSDGRNNGLWGFQGHGMAAVYPYLPGTWIKIDQV